QGGRNLYGFAGGDPINFRDPFGLCPDPEDIGCQWFESGMTALGMTAGFVLGGGAGVLMTIGSGGVLAPVAVATTSAATLTGGAIGLSAGRYLSNIFFS